MFNGASSHTQRFVQREPLMAQLAELLAHDGCQEIRSCSRRIAALLENVGVHAARVWNYRREDIERQAEQRLKQKWIEDATVRTQLVMRAFEQNNKKLGKSKATPRALRHWRRRLLATDRVGIRVRPPRYPRWEEVVADALIETLVSALGRPLQNPRTKAAEREIKVLIEAFSLVECVARAPDLIRGKGVRRPGTASWFISRVATITPIAPKNAD